MIQLSDHFNYKRLLQFTYPTIVMLIISSVYGVVDGYFVSNFVGKTPFTAINFIMPFLLILGCMGFLFGTGGGALIAKTMGEGRQNKASKQFSLLIYASSICGVLLAVFGMAALRWIASALGAEGRLLEDSVTYGRVVLLAIPAYILQCEFQCLFATAEKPKLGLYIAIAAGVTNMVLDFLFIVVFKWGLVGAAAATAIGQLIGGIVPVIYFSRPNDSLLRLTKTKFDGSVLLKTASNGSSELMTNISTSVVSMLYNAQLLKYAGEDGVASYGVLLYVALLFQAVFIGYSVGTAPVISYHYGAKNHNELSSLRRKEHLYHNRLCCCYVCGRGTAVKTHCNAFCRLRPGIDGYDAESFYDLLFFIPVLRIWCLGFQLFHCVKRRSSICPYCFYAYPGIPGCICAYIPIALAAGRYLVLDCWGGIHGSDCYRIVLNWQAKKISLLN